MTFVFSSLFIHVILIQAQKVLLNISRLWMTANQLTVNSSKTEFFSLDLSNN